MRASAPNKRLSQQPQRSQGADWTVTVDLHKSISQISRHHKPGTFPQEQYWRVFNVLETGMWRWNGMR